ncbi:type I secretion C-terminal target domain-containing protein, partial [Halomonas campaniensis]|uniref:type I secretion C-terminal target domain-containing protein n=1 Tax=Halomonas campaniensis TaxID=213554 RepID=UPI003970FD02
ELRLPEGLISLVATATDADGDIASESVDLADYLVILDDGPSFISPDTGFLVNDPDSAFNTFMGKLDLDGMVEDNFGADHGGTVRFTATNGTATALTSGGAIIYLYVSTDGQTLIGSTFASGDDAESEDVLAEKVFTINLNVDTDGVDTYNFTLHQQIDGGAGSFSVTDEGYDATGGNSTFYFFEDTSDADRDVLLSSTSGGTVNTNANQFGVDQGPTIGPEDGIRIDYVRNLDGDPKGTITFDQHYDVNGASAVFFTKGVSTVRFVAKDDPDGNTIVGDGVSDEITAIIIRYAGGEITVFKSAANTDQPDGEWSTVTVGGVDFTVNFTESEAIVGGVIEGAEVGVTTADGFSSLEIWHYDGANFALGGFGGVSFVPGEAVDFGIDLDIIDGDGDSLTVIDAIKLQLAPDSHIVQEAGDGGESLTVADDTEGMLLGGDGDDTLTGNEGNDIIYGGEGDDTIVGVGGDNLLYGGAGNDTITGGEGNDTIIGGAGDDELTGGGGNNVFVWHLGDQGADGSVATDTVTDFTLDGDGADKLVLSDLLQDMESADDLSSYLHAVEDGDNTILHISAAGELSVEEGSISGADQVIVLSNVDMGEMDSGQFLQSLIESGQLDIE